MLNRLLKIGKLLALCTSILFLTSVKADFLRMPEIEELRKIKEQTLLRDMDVPPVRDRSPDPTAGPRLAVAQFRIQGLVEYPELGITHEAIYKLVESIRFDLMDEGKLLESGYTINELAEVSDLLVDIEEETIDRHVTSLEVQKLIWLIRSQQGKRGVTLGQIEGVADSITQFYRQHGFILAKAYIPKQEVRDGIVNLTVLLGVLGEIDVVGNELYQTDLIKEVFNGDLNEPVTNKKIEESLFMINGFPGINVDGFFEPGKQVGDTKLNINVRNEDRYNFTTRVDNHGSETSGLYRVFLSGQANNVFGFADSFNVDLLQTVFPEDTTYWKLNYDTNFFSPKTRLSIDLSQNQFVADQSSIVANVIINGTVTVYGIQGQYIAQRSRKENSSYQLRYENIDSDLLLNGDEFGNTLDEALEQISFSYKFDILDDVNKRIHDVKLGYKFGDIGFGAKGEQEEQFHVLSLDYTLLNFVKVPFFNATSRIVFHSYNQYSGTTLSSIARFSLTGPTKLRGFSPSYFTADDAAYLGVEWVFNSPKLFDVTLLNVNFNNVFKPFLFADYAFGYQYLLPSDTSQESNATAHLGDIGVGLQISHNNGFSGNIQLGFPVLNELDITEEEPESDTARLNVDFQYAF